MSVLPLFLLRPNRVRCSIFMYMNVIGLRLTSARDARIMQDTIENHSDPMGDFNYFFEYGIVLVPGTEFIVGITW